jgi:hypothetical protein
MKVSIYPEDILIEYTKSRLKRENFAHPDKKHIKRFPETIELSSEFGEKWQKLVSSTIKAYLGRFFVNRKFLVDQNGSIKSFYLSDHEIWQNLDFTFSIRSAQRLYERMLADTIPDYKIFQGQHLIATVADALFISICTNNFTNYNFPWLVKNKANWLIKAVYIAKASNWEYGLPSWGYFLENYEENEFPLRELLIEKVGLFLAEAASSISGSDIVNQRVSSNVTDIYNFYNKALTNWKEKCLISYEDVKYLDSAVNNYKIVELYNTFTEKLLAAQEESAVSAEIFNNILE